MRGLIAFLTTLSTGSGADRLTGDLARCTVDLLGADAAAVWLMRPGDFTPRMHRAHTRADSNMPPSVLHVDRFPSPPRAYLTTELAPDPLVAEPAWLESHRLTVLALHPLLAGGRLLGWVGGFWEHHSTEGEHALGAAAGSVALALDNALLRRAQDGLGRGLASVFEQMSDALIMTDGGGRVVASNAVARGLLGPSLESAPLEEWGDACGLTTPDGSPIPPADLPLARALRGEIVRGADALVHPAASVPAPIRWNAAPLPTVDGGTGGAVMVGRDISAEHAAEHSLALRVRELTGLHELGQILTLDDQPVRVQGRLLARLADLVGATHAAVFAWEEATSTLRAVPPTFGFDSDQTALMTVHVDDERDPSRRALSSPVAVQIEANLEGGEHGGMMRALGLQHAILVRLAMRGRAVGLLTVYRATGSLDREGTRLLETFAGQVGAVLESLRLYSASASARATFEAVFRQMTDGVLIGDPRGALMAFNPGAEQALDTQLTPFTGASPTIEGRWVTLAESTVVPLSAVLDRACAGESITNGRLRFTDGTGADRSVLIAAQPLDDGRGGHQGAMVILRDVSVQQAARRERARMAGDLAGAHLREMAVIQSMQEGVAVYNAANLIVRTNPYLLDLLDEREGAGVIEGMDGPAFAARYAGLFADPVEYTRVLRESAAHPLDTHSDELEMIAPHPRIVERVSAPMVGEEGEFLGRVVVYRDLTDARQAERAKAQLLSVASHELKTPLTTIRGHLQLLLRRIDRGNFSTMIAERGLKAALDQADRLGDLVADLLDVARLQTGRVELRREHVDLAGLTAEVVERLRSDPLTTPRHRLHYRRPRSAVAGEYDRGRIDQVLQNVVGNALKYSPEGGDVMVTIARKRGMVLIRVRDRGIGVDPADVVRLFQPFGRASSAADHHISGFGLGLYISRDIVQRHGGQLDLAPAPDRGVVVTIALPVHGSQPDHTSPPEHDGP